MRRHAGVKRRKTGDHIRHEEHHQQDDQDDQHRRVHQRHQDFLPHPQRQFLVGDEALQHFDEAARFFARHDGRHVNLRENALLPERLRQQRAAAHVFADGIDVGGQFRVGQPLGKQVERLENRQSGADQRDELLVEDQEFFQIQPPAPAGEGDVAGEAEPGAFRLHRIDQESLLRVALANFLRGGALRHLAVHFAARIRVFQNEVGHSTGRASTICTPGGAWKVNSDGATGAFNCSFVNVKSSFD